jgi:hypothetical protein
MMFCHHIGNIFLTFFEELVHVSDPELVNSVDFIIELIVKLISFFFVGHLDLMKLPVFELLLAMFPLDTAPFSINVFSFLFMFDHLLVEDSQILVKT